MSQKPLIPRPLRVLVAASEDGMSCGFVIVKDFGSDEENKEQGYRRDGDAMLRIARSAGLNWEDAEFAASGQAMFMVGQPVCVVKAIFEERAAMFGQSIQWLAPLGSEAPK